MDYCEICDITLSRGRSMKRHMKTIKHIKNTGDNACKNGKIYKIVNLDDESKVYIGSTCETLEDRYGLHKVNKRQYERGIRGYTSSFDILDNSKIELIENYPCNSETELKKREQYYMDNIKCINKHNAYGHKHYDYYNKKFDCECGLTYTYQHKNRYKKTARHIKRMSEINN